jgi:Holliday junction resolvasome RuvABC DNA-binding subunit
LEGAYEEALHLLRLHIVKTFKRDEKKMYGFRKVNPRIQKARAEQREELFAKKDIQRILLKLKSKLKSLRNIKKTVQQHEESE